MKYLVTWQIDSDAETPHAAAFEARAAQTRCRTWATVFEVKEHATGTVTLIDVEDNFTLVRHADMST